MSRGGPLRAVHRPQVALFGSVLVQHPKELTRLCQVPVVFRGPQPGAPTGLNTIRNSRAVITEPAREAGPRCTRASPTRVIARLRHRKWTPYDPHVTVIKGQVTEPLAVPCHSSEAASAGFEPTRDRLQSRDAHALGAEHTRARAPGKVCVGHRDSGTYCHPGTPGFWSWINTQGKNEYLGPPKEMHQNVPNDEKLDMPQTSNHRRTDTQVVVKARNAILDSSENQQKSTLGKHVNESLAQSVEQKSQKNNNATRFV